MQVRAMVLLAVLLAGSGCAGIFGPNRLTGDRQGYIEALNVSWKEMLLNNLVKLRYGEALSFLDITAISAQYQLEGSLEASNEYAWPAGYAISQYTRNLLRPMASVRYQNQPQITFTPLSGDAVKAMLLKRIPVNDLWTAMDSGWPAKFIMPYCVQSVNSRYNEKQNKKFFELVTLVHNLIKEGQLHVILNGASAEGPPKGGKESDQATAKTSPEGGKKLLTAGARADKGQSRSSGESIDGKLEKIAANLTEFTDNLVKKQKEKGAADKDKDMFILLKNDHPEEVKRFRELLDLDPTENNLYKVVEGYPQPNKERNIIYVHAHSVGQVLTFISKFIHLPKDPPTAPKPGFENYFPPDSGIEEIQILSSTTRPKNPYAAVKYQDIWYYISNDDINSKEIFSNLLGVCTMLQTFNPQTPVLTLPVR
jgi:hypothetical protein